jgi:hypothetical protein
MKFKFLALCGAAASLLALPALGHHSFAMFDNSQTEHLEGTITDFEWLNPHVWLHVSVAAEDGTAEVWSFEAGSTGQLAQSYWDADSVRAGEVLSDVTFHPLKDGSNGGQLREVTKADGTYLCQGPDCREKQRLEREAAARPDPQPIPSFAGYWQRRGRFPSTWEMPDDPAQRPGPLMTIVTGPSLGALWVADHEDTILRAWNGEYLRERGIEELIEVQTVAHNICWPSGVPQVANMREPVQFLQSEDQITILYQRDHQIRRVYLNQKHPENFEPSWYGHSVGHYEGDTLVIDTIGLREGTGVDRFNTQHTDKLRVVERYRIIEDGQALRLNFVVEDLGAFTAPWYGQATYGTHPGPVNEVACAENNRDITQGMDAEYPIPTDNGPPAF